MPPQPAPPTEVPPEAIRTYSLPSTEETLAASSMRPPERVLPEHLAGGRVECLEDAPAAHADEDEPAGGRGRAADHRRRLLVLPGRSRSRQSAANAVFCRPSWVFGEPLGSRSSRADLARQDGSVLSGFLRSCDGRPSEETLGAGRAGHSIPYHRTYVR